MVYKPIPKLRSQKIKIHRDYIPDIQLEIGFMNVDTEEITIVKGDKTPIKQFNPRRYKKLFEVGTVMVSYLRSLNDCLQI